MTDDAYASFAPFYDAWASKMTEDIDFYVRRAREAGGPVVELGAGTGRVSIPIARAGVDVIAVDASPSMIEIGRKRAAEEGVADRITWVEAHMQGHVADPPAPLVIIPFRSFIHLTTLEDQLAALASIRASLVPGGRLALNLFVPDPAFIVEHHGQRTPSGDFTDEHGRSCALFAEQTYEITSQRLHLRTICEVYDGDRVVETHTADLEAALIHPREMRHLLERSGFEVESVYGWFDERPLTEDCREMIWVARRP